MRPDVSQGAINAAGFLENWRIQSGQKYVCPQIWPLLLWELLGCNIREELDPDDANVVLSHAHKDAESKGPSCNPSLSTALRKLPVSNIMAEIL